MGLLRARSTRTWLLPRVMTVCCLMEVIVLLWFCPSFGLAQSDIYVSTAMDWNSAHEYCRRANMFLAGAREWKSLKVEIDDNGYLEGDESQVWTALHLYEGYFQWLDNYPNVYPKMYNHRIPKDGGPCVALLLSNNSFASVPCSRNLTFFCYAPEKLKDLGVPEGAIELRLRVSKDEQTSGGLPADTRGQGAKNWTKLGQTEWVELEWNQEANFSCFFYNRTTQKEVMGISTSFISKGGTFLYHRTGRKLLPKSPHRYKQGVYSCHAWVAKTKRLLSSSKVLLTLRGWHTFTASLRRPIEGIHPEHFAKDLISRTIPENNFSIASLSFNISRDNDQRASPYMTDYTFFLFIQDPAEVSLKDLKELFEFNDTTSTSYVVPTTHCLKREYPLNGSRSLVWPSIPVGTHTHPKEPYRCTSDNKTLSSGHCTFNLTHGASYITPTIDNCSILLCPKDWTTVMETMCVAVSHQSRWQQGLKEVFGTQIDRLVTDLDIQRRDQGLMEPSVVEFLLEELNTSVVWLPARRPAPHLPIDTINNFDSSFLNRLTWAKDHPMYNENCVALDLSTMVLRTANCQKELSHVNIVDYHQNDLLYEHGSQCRLDWFQSRMQRKNPICFRGFKVKSGLSWNATKQYCGERGASLVSPQRGFNDHVFRNYLRNNFPGETYSVWINMRRHADDFETDGIPFDVLKWTPDTNYSLEYGVLSPHGWTLEDGLQPKAIILCEAPQRPVEVPYLSLRPSDTNASSLCLRGYGSGRRDLPKDLKCFLNENIENLLYDSAEGCYRLSDSSESGSRWCGGWAWTPPYRVESNRIWNRPRNHIAISIGLLSPNISYNSSIHDVTFATKNSSSEHITLQNILHESPSFNCILLSTVLLNHHGKLLTQCNLGCTPSNVSEDTVKESVRHDQEELKVIYLRSTDRCPRELTNDSSHGMLTWEATFRDNVVAPVESCVTQKGDPVTRKCQSDVLGGLEWTSPSGECNGTPSKATTALWKISKNITEYSDVIVASLNEVIQRMEEFLPSELFLLEQILKEVAKKEVEKSSDWLHLMAMVITKSENVDVSRIYPHTNPLNSIMKSFSAIALSIESTLDGRLYEFPGLSVGLASLQNAYVGFQANDDETNFLNASSPGSNKDYDSISFSEQLNIANGQNSSKVLFARYRTLNLTDLDSRTQNYKVASTILEVAFENYVLFDRDNPLKLQFVATLNGSKPLCVFWDHDRNNGRGGWSKNGCWLNATGHSTHVCLCIHATSFALLVKVDDSSIEAAEIHKHILQFWTLFGFSISFISLALVFITACLFKKWRELTGNRIVLQYSWSIFLSIIFFLGSFSVTNGTVLCRLMAAGLHYSIVTSFNWILVMSVFEFYKKVKALLHPEDKVSKFHLKVSLFAWGTPLLVIIVTYFSMEASYDNPNVCWLSVNAFMYFFLPILCLTVVISAYFHFRITWMLMCGRKITSTQSREQKMVIGAIESVCLFLLLGFNWIFGLLAIFEDDTLVFSYLFCIFNSLQGFYIFAIRVLLSKASRENWRRFLNLSQLMRRSDNSAGKAAFPNVMHFKTGDQKELINRERMTNESRF